MKDLLLPPSYGNRLHYPWIIVFFRGGEGKPPEFFATHGKNWAKFDTNEKKAQGFEIKGHIKEKRDASAFCAWANQQLKQGRWRRSGPKFKYQSTESKGGIDNKAIGINKPNQPKLFIPPHIKIKKD